MRAHTPCLACKPGLPKGWGAGAPYTTLGWWERPVCVGLVTCTGAGASTCAGTPALPSRSRTEARRKLLVRELDVDWLVSMTASKARHGPLGSSLRNAG